MNTTTQEKTTLKMQAVTAIPLIRPFLSRMQLAVMVDACRGEEKEFFMQKLVDLVQQIDTMPKTYEQDGMGDKAIAHLHYFLGGSDWFITEKDMDGGIKQAFGYAILNDDDECAVLGYISIEEITRCGAELDLHFTPCSLAEVKAGRARADEENKHEAELRAIWNYRGVPQEKQNELIAAITAKAQPGAAVGPFIVPAIKYCIEASTSNPATRQGYERDNLSDYETTHSKAEAKKWIEAYWRRGYWVEVFNDNNKELIAGPFNPDEALTIPFPF